MCPLDKFKLRYLNQLKRVASFSSAWKIWHPHISKKITSLQTGQNAFDLGDHLSDIFQSTSISGRSQSTISAGGVAWECLVTWYLNLVFWGTSVVAVRQNKEFVPQCISDCLTVTIANKATNTESDILVFSVPEVEALRHSSIKYLNEHLNSRLQLTDLVVLQCKTNWNDNAQIPMLWDLIYNSDSRLTNVSVGVNGLSPRSFRKFKYSFATVPSNKIEKIKPKGVNVLRVKNLTGGNYWGRRSVSDIAASIKEFPSRHFPSMFVGGVANHISKKLFEHSGDSPDFLKLEFDYDEPSLI